MARYQIWDKTSNVIVPTGKVFTPEEWIEQYPIAGLPDMDIVIAGGTVNGAFFSEYTSFIQHYTDMGCDFEGCESQQDCCRPGIREQDFHVHIPLYTFRDTGCFCVDVVRDRYS